MGGPGEEGSEELAPNRGLWEPLCVLAIHVDVVFAVSIPFTRLQLAPPELSSSHLHRLPPSHQLQQTPSTPHFFTVAHHGDRSEDMG